MARKKRRNWPLIAILLLLAAFSLGYVFGIPLLTTSFALSATESGRLPGQLTPLGEQIHFRLFEFLIFAWLFMFGASIGSFLNVVIYRTPRGISLLGTSRCPRCCQAIRPRDNLPVFGWLALRGRCRTCRLPISPRYPLVELTVAVLILVLATLEVLQAGANLPAEYDSVVGRAAISWLIRRPNWDLISTFSYHGALLCILLSWALIRYDGLAIPRGYVLFATMCAIAAPVFRPAVHPIAWIAEQPAWLAAHPWAGRIGTSLVGLAAGVLIASVLSGIDALTRRRWGCVVESLRDRIAALGLVGIALGWQAVLSVALLTAITQCMAAVPRARVVRDRTPPRLLFIFLATTVQVYFWTPLEQFPWWPNSSATALTLSLSTIAIALLTWFAGLRLSAEEAHARGV